MRVQLTIKNYRCFVRPTTIELVKGFTAFVGINNAGKSAFMRFVLEMRNLFGLVRDNPGFLNSLIGSTGGLGLLHVTDPEEVFSNLNDKEMEVTLDFFEEGEGSERSKLLPTRVVFRIQRNLTWSTEIYLDTGRVLFPNGQTSLQPPHFVRTGSDVVDLSEFFASLSILQNSLYIGPFRNTINIGTKADYLDIQIGESFLKNFRQLKTGPTKKHSAAISDLTEEIKRIFGFESLDISPSADDTSLHITINGKPYKQHELGSGLSQFIIVLANALVKRPKLILIDEPELNLHPSLQLDFLTSLGSAAEEGVWFSTHSIGLARSAAERVYSVQRKTDGDSVIRLLEGTARLPEFLGEMSFSSYKELGFEKILLVEGPTEVKTIQQFLRAMKKDHKIVLLPLRGQLPQTEELEELLRITKQVAALIDSERSEANEPIARVRQEFLDLCRKEGIKARALDRRATENYFSDKTVKAVLGTQFRALEPYQRLKDIEPHWGKNQNWKLAAATPLEEFKLTDFGEFLDEL